MNDVLCQHLHVFLWFETASGKMCFLPRSRWRRARYSIRELRVTYPTKTERAQLCFEWQLDERYRQRASEERGWGRGETGTLGWKFTHPRNTVWKRRQRKQPQCEKHKEYYGWASKNGVLFAPTEANDYQFLRNEVAVSLYQEWGFWPKINLSHTQGSSIRVFWLDILLLLLLASSSLFVTSPFFSLLFFFFFFDFVRRHEPCEETRSSRKKSLCPCSWPGLGRKGS